MHGAWQRADPSSAPPYAAVRLVFLPRQQLHKHFVFLRLFAESLLIKAKKKKKLKNRRLLDPRAASLL